MKRFISCLLVILVLANICACGKNESNRPLQRAEEPINEVNEKEAIEICTEIDKDIEQKYPGSRVMYQVKESTVNILIAIVDNDICNHAKMLYDQGADEDETWQKMKYGLEEYCALIQEKLTSKGGNRYSVESKLFNEKSMELFAESNGEEDYSILYIKNGYVVSDIIFDAPQTASANPKILLLVWKML